MGAMECGFATHYMLYRDAEKFARGSVVMIGEGRARRKWTVIDKWFCKFEKVYVHRIVPAQ